MKFWILALILFLLAGVIIIGECRADDKVYTEQEIRIMQLEVRNWQLESAQLQTAQEALMKAKPDIEAKWKILNELTKEKPK